MGVNALNEHEWNPRESGLQLSVRSSDLSAALTCSQLRPAASTSLTPCSAFASPFAEFAGRNWNAGETIEIVLRRPDDSLYASQSPTGFLQH